MYKKYPLPKILNSFYSIKGAQIMTILAKKVVTAFEIDIDSINFTLENI